MNTFGLPDVTVQKICSVFAAYPQIEKVFLYGSRAMGNWRNGSDIDLCVVVESLALSDVFAIENRLDDLLLPWKIDLALRNQISNKDFLDHIARVGQVFYQRKDEL